MSVVILKLLYSLRGRVRGASEFPILSEIPIEYVTLFKSTDLVKPQAVARVGGNGEWGIHGIIGKEVIEGRAYYCVDWEPTMMPLDELCGAERLVREFEAKEQARLRRAGNTRKKKHR